MNKHYYFAYGMNTNRESMARRCPDAKSLGAAALYDWGFRFAYHADIVPTQGERTVGVLWEITDRCSASLDQLEGYPNYYDRKIVSVIYRNQQYDSLVYYMTPGSAECPPPENYWRMLREGYREHNVSSRQLWDAVRRSYEPTESQLFLT